MNNLAVMPVCTAAAGACIPFRGLLVLPGLLVGAIGWWIGPDFPELLGSSMRFAAGGILYLLFQDIAPQSPLERHWVPYSVSVRDCWDRCG